MKLIVGGAYQGKKEAACRLFGCQTADFIDGKDCAPEELRSCSAIYNFHEYIFRCMQEGTPVNDIPAVLQRENPEILIITDEVGYGVVPIEKTMRDFREQVGRICCQLAEISEVVVRVVAGMPMFIKDVRRGNPE